MRVGEKGEKWAGLDLRKLYHDGSPEMGAHVRSNLCCFICSRHLIRWRLESGHKSDIFLQKDLFSFMLAQQDLSTMVMAY